MLTRVRAYTDTVHLNELVEDHNPRIKRQAKGCVNQDMEWNLSARLIGFERRQEEKRGR